VREENTRKDKSYLIYSISLALLSSFVAFEILQTGGVEVAVVEDADAFELAFVVHVIKHALVHDGHRAFFAHGAIFLYVELGNELYEELIAERAESPQVQDFPGVGRDGFIVFDELLRAVERIAGLSRIPEAVRIL
jgi:hypothetical protein